MEANPTKPEPTAQQKMDRRRALQWMLAAAASASMLPSVFTAVADPAVPRGKGYGPSPDVQKNYKPGDVWPLTMNATQRRTATTLCDTMIPADQESPSASQVGVVDFIDEWISAPYDSAEFPFQRDRILLLDGLAWLDTEASQRFKKSFADLSEEQRNAICDDICYLAHAKPAFVEPARFFARFRDLCAGGFYTTPEGMKDLKYVGNVPLATFDGPPLHVLKQVGLA